MKVKVLGVSIVVMMFVAGLLVANPQAIGAPPQNNPGQPFEAILQKLDEIIANLHDEGPPAGIDTFPTIAEIEFDSDLFGQATVPLVGEMIVQRSEPDTATGTIQTEILSMSLSGFHPGLGDVTLKRGTTFGLPPSTGAITPISPDSTFPATSFFDVFVEIEIGGLQLHSVEPLRIQTDEGNPIKEIPPIETPFTNDFDVELFRVGDTEGEPLGRISEGSVFVPTTPSQAIIKKEIIDLKKDITEIKDTLGDGGTPPPGPTCGNGIVEDPEECDDGNTVSGDGCSSTCQDELKDNGEPCEQGVECSSGFCSDDVCSDTACNGVCESANLAGSVGTCTLIPAGVDPDEECQVDACATGTCNGLGACGIRPFGFVCRAVAGECDIAELCDGVSTICPADGFEASGTPCGDTLFCNGEETCDGTGFCTPGAPACDLGVVCDEASDQCVDASSCAGSDVCGDHAVCVDRPGGFDCICDEGYRGSGTTCTAFPEDCRNGVDDDNDGLTDLNDPDCTNIPSGEACIIDEQCTSGICRLENICA